MLAFIPSVNKSYILILFALVAFDYFGDPRSTAGHIYIYIYSDFSCSPACIFSMLKLGGTQKKKKGNANGNRLEVEWSAHEVEGPECGRNAPLPECPSRNAPTA